MSDDGLFREVDEEVRREQLGKLWERFGNVILGACIGVVLLVGGFKGWQYWQNKLAEEAGMEWYQAIRLAEEGKAAEADAAFDKISESGHAGYAALAELSQAARLGQDGKSEEAVALYDKVANDGSVDDPLRNLARVRAAYLLVDTADVADIRQRLSGLNNPQSSWRHGAREVLMLANVRRGDIKAADQLAAEILTDPATPAAMRARVQLVSAQLQSQLPPATD
jgi:hypothetical protein